MSLDTTNVFKLLINKKPHKWLNLWIPTYADVIMHWILQNYGLGA